MKLDPRPLYKWYHAEKRDLPFRENRDPYAVWVSEVMLQQTRVAAMLPRYNEFMKRFPDLKSLAACREEQVLAAWRGLGYYSRARNLRMGAKRIMKEHGGEFPRETKAALNLEGVGPYTAAAVLSICYGEPEPVLDGNVKRVLARLFDADTPEALHEKKHQERALTLMESRGRTDPGDHNQALMELGAMICIPGKPACGDCPLQKKCLARARGGPAYAATLPPKRKEEKIDVLYYIYVVTDAKGENLWIAREKESRFLKNLWFFPTRQEVAPATTPVNRRLETLSRATPGLEAILNLPGLRERTAYARRFRHTITHHRIEGIVERVVLGRGNPVKQLNQKTAGRVEWKCIPFAEMETTIVSSLTPKILKIIASEASANPSK